MPGIIIIVLLCIVLYYYFNREKIKGKAGEKTVAAVLSRLGKEYIVYNDVLIKNGQYTSQIDHVVVSPYGIFVIETKNYRGWIYGGVKQEKWTQNIWGTKNSLPNPIRQNKGHIIALKNILPVFNDDQYVSIVVFSLRADLKSSIPDEYNVIYISELFRKIKSYNNQILTEENISEIKKSLDVNLIKDRAAQKEHIAQVSDKITAERKLVNSGICPRCKGELIKRQGKYGPFYGCSNYPQCRFTLRIDKF